MHAFSLFVFFFCSFTPNTLFSKEVPPKSNSTLSSLNQTFQVESKIFLWDGETTNLLGSVQLTHPLISVNCHQAFIFPSHESPSFLPPIKVKKNVQIQFQDGSTLTCAKASLKNSLFTAQGQVHEPCTFKDAQKKISLKAHRIQISFFPFQNQLSQPSIQKIQAQKDVHILLEGNHQIFCDEALWESLKQKTSLLTFFKTSSPGICRMEHVHGHWVEGSKIVYGPFPNPFLSKQTKEFSLQQIWIDQPKGLFCLDEPPFSLETSLKSLAFQAQTLFYDPSSDKVKLKKQVQIFAENQLLIESQDSIQINPIDLKHLSSFKSSKKESVIEILALGQGFLQYTPLEKENHLLKWPSNAHLDLKKQNISIFGNKQDLVIYEGKLGCLQGENVAINLSKKAPFYQIERVQFSNNTSIKRKDPLEQDPHSYSQYALADFLVYTPSKDFMELFMEDESINKILFFDKKSEVKMTAKKIFIKNANNPKKAKIQGKGKVSFFLEDLEWQTLQSRFKQEDL